MTDSSANPPGETSSQEIESWTEGSDGIADYVSILREKILFGLTIYPAVSPTMLHTFLGTSTSTHVWKPILNDLIGEGLVERTEVTLTSPHDRVQTYTIIHRTDKPYNKPAYTLDSDSDSVNNSGNENEDNAD